MNKLFLYSRTIANMRPCQVIARIKKAIGLKNSIGIQPAKFNEQIVLFKTAEELDFDPAFLARFSADEFVTGKVTFLHESETIDWNRIWNIPNRSPLWNFNLHYFEYLMTFIHSYKVSHAEKYLDGIKKYIISWIDNNPKKSGGYGWESYTISMRLTYWFSTVFNLANELDEKFLHKVLSSIYEQYIYLAIHLEKDILANHYLENLKALIFCAIVFNDTTMLEKALSVFKEQCNEQILSDGMHFELSPTYHKIALEALLRIAIALRSIDKADLEVEKYIQPMIDVAYSFEEGLERIPLFNDGGNNVAKSLNALMQTVKNHFNIIPSYKNIMPESGYYIFKKDEWKLIVDAGSPGPKYNPGHAHCDAMSYELFKQGKPIVVNSGTYAYQCKDRSFFRSTEAHNTVKANNEEQSECWGVFRLGKGSSTKVLNVSGDSITIMITDYKKQQIKRKILLDSTGIHVKDYAEGISLLSYVHIMDLDLFSCKFGKYDIVTEPYAIDYGRKTDILSVEICSKSNLTYSICTKKKEMVNDVSNSMKDDYNKKQYKGYKPLVAFDRHVYFYSKGKLWTERNGNLRAYIQLATCSWKDRNRLMIRFFRREPKYAVPINDHQMIIVWKKQLLLVDVSNREIFTLHHTRDGFSDPLNICKANYNWIALWGDYGNNNDKKPIYIYGIRSDLTIEKVYTFDAGQIRHVHNIIPKVGGGYWIFTGDLEEKAGIYETDDYFASVKAINIGEQKYRAVIGFDTPDGLLYATDAVNERNYVYLYKDGIVKEICPLNGSCIYGKEHDKAYYFSTTVEPDENNKGVASWLSKKRGAGIITDDVILVRISRGLAVSEIARFKKDFWPMKLMQYGSIQFAKGEGEELWIYPVAVKQYDGYAMKL